MSSSISKLQISGTLLLVVGGMSSIGVAQTMNDPTRPPPAAIALPEDAAVEDRSLDLSAIFFAEGRRVAIINGIRLQEGDSVANARIEKIAAGRVELLQEGEIEQLELVGPKMKGMKSLADEETGK